MSTAKKKTAKNAEPSDNDEFEVVLDNVVIARQRMEPGSVVKRSQFPGCNVEALVASGHLKKK